MRLIKRKLRRTSASRSPRGRRRGRTTRRSQRASLVKAIPTVAVIAVISGGVWGARRLEAYMVSRPEYQTPPEIILVDVPEGIEDSIRTLIEPLTGGPWTRPDLCRRMAETLSASPWVKSVEFVRRFAHGRVSISCQYRLPAALVQMGGDFYAIGADRVRLPGTYQYSPALVLIQGVTGMVPPAGEVWTGKELRAALDVVMLLHKEPFFEQVTAILVDNYGGRRDEHASHLQLVTAPGDHRIAWGSSPGEEIEENTVQQKIALLRANYRRWGRIDAGRREIDISVFPDRFTTPVATSAESEW